MDESLQDLNERYGRDVVEPVIEYVNEATGIEWLSVGEDLGHGPRYLSNVTRRTWQGGLAGVYALLYLVEVVKARKLGGNSVMDKAHRAGTDLSLWLYQAGPLHMRNMIRDRADEAREAGRAEGHPNEQEHE